MQLLWKPVCQVLKKLNIVTIWHSNSTPGVYTRELKMCPHKNVYLTTHSNIIRNGYEVVSHWEICISLMTNEVKNFFHVFISHLHILFREMPFQTICPLNCIIFLLLNYQSSLHIFDTSSLSDVWFSGVFN